MAVNNRAMISLVMLVCSSAACICDLDGRTGEDNTDWLLWCAVLLIVLAIGIGLLCKNKG